MNLGKGNGYEEAMSICTHRKPGIRPSACGERKQFGT